MSLSLSIITPCLNRVADVESAIQSVLRQGYQNMEHIVIDGGSTDGTLDVLARFPHLIVLSEKDHGMYDALNKGLQLASGEIIGFLNTDDLYADGAFQHVMECFEDRNIDAVAGKAQIFKEEKNGEFRSVLELSPPHSDKLIETAITGSTIFNAWFYRKSLIQRVGGFDPQYRISGDADLILRLALIGIKYLALGSVHYLYRQHHDSMTFEMNSAKLLRAFQDHSLFIQKYISSDELSNEVKTLFRALYFNTCSALASQFRSEGKTILSFLWRARASLDITSPTLRRLAL
jgi:glycosyltransferase involved in cell wall biosynthesis